MTSDIESSKTSPNSQHPFEQAYFYYEAEDYEKALQACDEALELDPYSSEAHNLRGILLEELGRIFEARKAYRQAIKLNPDCSDATDNLSALEDELSEKIPLVTIATFSYPTEAYITKSKLDAFGIWSFVADDYTVMMNWLFSNAIGGVKLQVKENDAEQARKIITSNTSVSKIEDINEKTGEFCPSCHSPNIYYNRYNLRAFFTFWFLSYLFGSLFGFGSGFSIPFFKRRWRCANCGYEWIPSDKQ